MSQRQRAGCASAVHALTDADTFRASGGEVREGRRLPAYQRGAGRDLPTGDPVAKGACAAGVNASPRTLYVI